MAAVEAISRVSQTPFQGVGYLSKTFQSSQVHTPLHLDRITNSEQSYNGYIHDKRSWLTKPIWGNSSLLKGSDTRSLPSSEAALKQNFNLSHLNKSHLNFGGGELSYGRSFPIQAKYDVTNLQRSYVRPTDELIPSSNKVNLRSDMINLPFPAQHPQNSHMPKFAAFPGQDSPDNTLHGRLALTRSTSLPSFAPSGSDNYVVAEKIKGSPHRREIVRVLSDSERRPLQWHGHSFNQFVKGPDMQKQQHYPTPPTSVKPDFWDRPPSLSVSQKTAAAQQNIEALNGDSEYTRQYAANGSRNANQVETGMHPTQTRQKMLVAPKTSSEGKNEQPYDTTYNKDYTVDVNTSRPTSILRSATTKKLNESKRNKSVKFSQNVTVSNGYQTSSSSVNDVQENGNHHQLLVQMTNTPRPIAAIAPNTERPSTAPNIQRQSILQTTPLLFPSAPQTQFNANALQTRPYSTGVFRAALRNDLRHLQDNYSKSATHRKFNNEFPERAPDIRRTPDMRITINERRHVIPEIGRHSYYFHG